MPFLLSIGLLLLPYLLPSLPVIRLIHFILVLVNMKLSFTQESFYPMCRGLIQLLQEMFLGPLVIILIAFKSIKSKAYLRMISSLFYKLESKCSSTFSLNFLHFKRRRSWTNITCMFQDAQHKSNSWRRCWRCYERWRCFQRKNQV